MKFKAVLTDAAGLKEFHNLIGTISKLAKEAVFCLEKNGIRILSCHDVEYGAPLCWITIGHDFFARYDMTGVDDQNKNILLAIEPKKLAAALIKLRDENVICVKLKLTKNQFPCLSVVIETPAAATNYRQIVHDIPVRVVPVDEYSEYKTPEVPKCQLEFDMPSLKSLKALCDAMKNLSPTLTIYGCLGGELRFVVDTDSLMVSNRYINRNVQKTNYDGMPQIDGDEVACTVNAKQLAFHFISNQFQSVEMSGALLQDEVFSILFQVRPSVTMNYLFCGIEQ